MAKVSFQGYEVVVADSVGKLEARVNEKLAEGKILIGGVSITYEGDPDLFYAQAIAHDVSNNPL